MNKLFAILEMYQSNKPDNRYKGRTGMIMTEEQLRSWSAQIFKTDPKDELTKISKALEGGGWKLYQEVS